ncbi:YidB family protein [Streptomyces sp. NPDC002640]
MGALLVFLAENGLADEVGSWVSAEIENLPITGAQLLEVLDPDDVAEDAADAGMSVQEYADQLARELPAAADAITPDGELPDDEEFGRHFEEHFRR